MSALPPDEPTAEQVAFGLFVRKARGRRSPEEFGLAYGSLAPQTIRAYESGTRMPTARFITPFGASLPEPGRIEFDSLLEAAQNSRAASRRSETYLRDVEEAKELRRIEQIILDNRNPVSAIRSALRWFTTPVHRVRLYELGRAFDSALQIADEFGFAEDAVRIRSVVADELAECWRFDEAFQAIAPSLSTDRVSAPLWLLRGSYMWEAGRYVDSAAALLTARNLGADQGLVSFYLGQALLAQGYFAQAERELAKAIALADNSRIESTASAAHALALIGRGELEEAKAGLAIAKRKDPHNPRAYYYEGLCNFENQEWGNMFVSFQYSVVGIYPVSLSEPQLWNICRITQSFYKLQLSNQSDVVQAINLIYSGMRNGVLFTDSTRTEMNKLDQNIYGRRLMNLLDEINGGPNGEKLSCIRF